MSVPRYRRLPGRFAGLGYGSSLWEGDDHLLLVKWIAVSETYRRFYFRDIQAITICTTRSWIVTGVLLAVAGALCGIPAVWMGGFFLAFPGLPAAGLLAASVWNFWQGPSCRTVIQTAVQAEPIRSLHRRNQARKVIAQMRDRIIAAQEAAP